MRSAPVMSHSVGCNVQLIQPSLSELCDQSRLVRTRGRDSRPTHGGAARSVA